MEQLGRTSGILKENVAQAMRFIVCHEWVFCVSNRCRHSERHDNPLWHEDQRLVLGTMDCPKLLAATMGTFKSHCVV